MKLFYNFSILFFSSLFITRAIAQPVNQTFNATGTYTVPSGYSAVVTIEVWGGGGGGASSGSGGKGGGGGGGYATFATTLGSGSYAVTVGTGGTAGNAGGNSSFTALCVAGGGAAGTAGTGGTGGASITGTGFNGGNGGTTSSNDGGGGGGSATSIANGGNGAVTAGGTGQGNGGTGGLANNGSGAVGIAPGGGGGGKAGPGVGGGNSGAGANGRVIVTVNTVLFIRINTLNIGVINDQNTVNWQASCSSNEAVFTIERSTDGINFNSIHTIVASRERCSQPFTYIDNSVASGLYYYRIRTKDVDGRITFSAIAKAVGIIKDANITGMWPNPVTNTARISISVPKKNNVSLLIIATNGSIVQSRNITLQAGTTIFNFDVSELIRGHYILKSVFENGTSQTLKFIKN
jgi:hypothetical protein